MVQICDSEESQIQIPANLKEWTTLGNSEYFLRSCHKVRDREIISEEEDEGERGQEIGIRHISASFLQFGQKGHDQNSEVRTY